MPRSIWTEISALTPRKSTQDDPITAVDAQYLDYLIKIASWNRFLATDEAKIGSKGGIEPENG